jgi:cytosine/adenosine deaminase-related metal-dependent hydrolase
MVVSYRSSWLLPISKPPIRDAWVAIDGGRVVEVGRGAPREGADDRDLGSVAVLPGLVNAHTHLELSYLRGQVPAASTFVSWIREVMGARSRRADARAPEILTAIDRAIDEATAAGTALVGDISNTLVTFDRLQRSTLAGVVFYELIRFRPDAAERIVERARQELEALQPDDRIRGSLAAHAPYSVAPALFRAIRRATDGDSHLPLSVHLAESLEEVEFVRSGGGPWRLLLEEIGAWTPEWQAPGMSPVEYLEAAGFLDGRVVAAHGVQMTPSDLARLAARGTTLVTCPRSNRHTGAGVPPVEEFYRSGVRIAIGTDSLASAPDLNVFEELAALRALAPAVPAARLLDSATRQGAHALGFGGEYGTIEPGKRARLLAVEIPPGTADVEEYLVSGIRPGQVRWVD